MPPIVIASAITAGASLFSNRKKPAEKAIEDTTNKNSALTDTISRFANQQHSMADPAIKKAMAYYSQLAGNGGQSGLNAALAPQTNTLNDSYSGAERGLMARMAPGAQRDQALSDLYRQRVGQIGNMRLGARSGAMGSLASMGQNLNGNAQNLFGSAVSSTYGTLNGQQSLLNQQNSRSQGWSDLGKSLGGIFLNSGIFNRGGGNSTNDNLGGF